MRRCGNSRRKGHNVEAKEFGRFIAGMRKEKKMTQAELAEKIHVTDKAVSRWERGLGFPDIQTIEPLAQALGISVLELMRSERQEKAKEEAAPEIQAKRRFFLSTRSTASTRGNRIICFRLWRTAHSF